MKSAAHGGPMRRNFPSAFKSETGKVKKMTKEEMEAESLRKAMEGDFEVKVSGGKKTEAGKFIQYATNTGAAAEGASVTGSSIEHTKLRRVSRDPDYKMTSEERARLRELNLQTEQAYKTKVKEERKKKGYE